ncbi:MAG: type II secretion system protein GspE, partial [Thermodesulfobacteriota bacterium]
MFPEIHSLEPDQLPKIPLSLEGVSSRFIRENVIVPLEFKNNILKVAMGNPEDKETIDALQVATSAQVQ